MSQGDGAAGLDLFVAQFLDAIAAEITRIAPSAGGDDEELQAVAAFRSTADKLGQSAKRVAAIGSAAQSI